MSLTVHWWEKLSPCSIDGSSNIKQILAEHIEYVLEFELNSRCTCTKSTDIGCRFIVCQRPGMCVCVLTGIELWIYVLSKAISQLILILEPLLHAGLWQTGRLQVCSFTYVFLTPSKPCGCLSALTCRIVWNIVTQQMCSSNYMNIIS